MKRFRRIGLVVLVLLAGVALATTKTAFMRVARGAWNGARDAWRGDQFGKPLEKDANCLLIDKIVFKTPSQARHVSQGVQFLLVLAPQHPGRIEDYEFRLYREISRDGKRIEPWTVIQNWRAWPLEPTYVPESGVVVSYQVDVRPRAQPDDIRMHWVGQVAFHDCPMGSPANLLRNLLGDDFHRAGRQDALDHLAARLWLAVHMLHWEYEKVPLNAQASALARLPLVAEAKAQGEVCFAVRFFGGTVSTVDLSARSIRQADSPLTLEIDLRSYPRYRDAFDRLKSLSTKGRLMGTTMLAVYEGYHYGTPAFGEMRSIHDSVSHCGTQAELLKDLLDRVGVRGVETTKISLDDSIHWVIQLRPLGNEPLILDPTSGYIYRCRLEPTGCKALAEPIVLPQNRDLDCLRLDRLCQPGCRIETMTR